MSVLHTEILTKELQEIIFWRKELCRLYEEKVGLIRVSTMSNDVRASFFDGLENFFLKAKVLESDLQSKKEEAWFDASIFIASEYSILPQNDQSNLRKHLQLINDLYDLLPDELDGLEKRLDEVERNNSNFTQYYKPEVIFITAIPLEFRSILKRAKEIIRIDGGDEMVINEFIRVVDLSNKQKRRNFNLYCDILIECKKDIVIQARVYLPQQYGSDETSNFVSANITETIIKRPYFFKNINEVILVGICALMVYGNTIKNKDTGMTVEISDLVVATSVAPLEGIQQKNEGCFVTITTKLHRANFELVKSLFSEKIYKSVVTLPSSPDHNIYKEKNILFAPVLTVPFVKKDKGKINGLPESLANQINALEMESKALVSIAQSLGPDVNYNMFKSISDYADKKKEGLRHLKPYCADVAATFTFEYIKRKYINSTPSALVSES